MFTFHIRSGLLEHPHVGRLAVGYAGADPDPSRKGELGEGVNDPTKVSEKSVGPLPPGRYTISGPEAGHGGFTLRLTPAPGNVMHGRGGFLIHGDSTSAPGTASEGCIIVPRLIRWAILGSGDRDLLVVP